jgi:hypothetical protein
LFSALLLAKKMKVAKDTIKLNVIEMICVWESLFQPSENIFQLHQIMDLVTSIPLFRALHLWSEVNFSVLLAYNENFY